MKRITLAALGVTALVGFVATAVVFTSGPEVGSKAIASRTVVEQQIIARAATNDTVGKPLNLLLAEELWTPRDAYDAAHILMVPMHAAFYSGDRETIDKYREFITDYLADRDRGDLGRQTLLQFSYLLSRFAVLDGACSDFNRRLLEYLERMIEAAIRQPAWQWERDDFENMFARIEWKLTADPSDPSYLRAIIDEELFAVAIAADIATAKTGCGLPVPETVSQAVRLGYRIVTDMGTTDGEGWQFQPGVWRDHPDYKFAGHEHLAAGLSPSPVDGIGVDSSHSARLPLWLLSLQCSFPKTSSEYEVLQDIRDRFANQLLTVAEPPSNKFGGVRIRNFMSGHNGIYRYGYQTVGPGGGYGPYGLSFTFNLGWWAFLGQETSDLYQSQVASLPFGEEVTALYLQPVVTVETAPRDRHPRFTPELYLEGSLIKTVLASAELVASSDPGCGLPDSSIYN